MGDVLSVISPTLLVCLVSRGLLVAVNSRLGNERADDSCLDLEDFLREAVLSMDFCFFLIACSPRLLV